MQLATAGSCDCGDVSALISIQAPACSSQAAIADATGTLSYAELERRANQLAAYLSSVGVGPGVAAGVCMVPSTLAVVGALAILKAGGAYVPMDVSYPRERIHDMLSDAQVPVVLTDQRSASPVPCGTWRTVVLDKGSAEISRHGIGPQPARARLDDLAYIIYTSGSTGRPKGVEISRRSLLNLVAWHRRAFGLTKDDRASQIASFGFDAAVWEIWPYLASGASLHIADEETRKDPYLLRDWILRQGITIGFVPTGLAERIVRLHWPAQVALRMMLTGGDVLRHYPPANLPFTLVNNYGPTEATVVTTSGVVAPSESHEQLPHIGRPVLNADLYILDEDLNQVPPGSVGEIFVGGAGLAVGYRNRPDLTADKFIPSPFCPGKRLYRTGDLARYRSDGNLDFVGRTDEQVKVRGYRIELNEIMVALNRHEAIQDCIVVAGERSDGDKQLVAYVVLATNPKPVKERDLREFLARSLPGYMIPATFVCLPALPIGPNGKIDRSCLPEPIPENILSYEPKVAAQTPVEERVIEILRPLLNVQQIGINDNFFLIGGHSLLGAQLQARVRDCFGVELSLLSLFDRPRVAEISREIERLILKKLEMGEASSYRSPKQAELGID